MPPSYSTLTFNDGLALTATRLDVTIAGTPSPKAPEEQPVVLQNTLFVSPEETHAFLEASGGRFLAATDKDTSSQRRELWVWDTCVFMEVTYPPLSLTSQATPAQVTAHLYALVNEGWTEESLLAHKGLCVVHEGYTEIGHLLSLCEERFDSLSEALDCVRYLQRFSSPVTRHDMVRMDAFSSFAFDDDATREAVDAYLDTLLPQGQIVKHLDTLSKHTNGPSAVKQLRDVCAHDDTLRRFRMEVSPRQLKKSRARYEAWLLWINEKTTRCPSFLPHPDLGPMLALPSLLMCACADKRVRDKMDVLIDTMTPEALKAWWCTPDPKGKTGAQWFLSGLLGDGAVWRSWNSDLVKKVQKGRGPHDRVGFASPKAAEPERLAWGKDVLRRIEARIGAHEEAWISSDWSPAGVCLDVLATSSSSPLLARRSLASLELLPEKLWAHPVRGTTLQLFYDVKRAPEKQRFQEATLDVSFLHCTFTFLATSPRARLLSLLENADHTPAWEALLAPFQLQDHVGAHTFGGPYSVAHEDEEHRACRAFLLDDLYRLHAKAQLTQALTFPVCEGVARKQRVRA